MFRRAERHSRRVRVLKFGFPVIAVAALTVFAGYTVLARPDIPNVSVDLAKSTITDGKVVMANPRLDGFTKDNKPYAMTARRAIQDTAGGGVISLEAIDASVPFRGEETAEIAAQAAVYDSEAQTLKLDKPFTVTTSGGMKADLQSGFVDIQKGAMRSSAPVSITLNGSNITADSMSVSENGKVLVFERRVRLNIDAAAVKAAKADRLAVNEGTQP